MARVRLTKKAIVFILVGIVLLGGGLGYGLWYVNNQASNVAPTDSEAAPDAACEKDPNPNDCFEFSWVGEDCKKTRIGGCNTGDGGDAAQKTEAGNADSDYDYDAESGRCTTSSGDLGYLCDLSDCGKGSQCYTGTGGCNVLFRSACGYDPEKGATYESGLLEAVCESDGIRESCECWDGNEYCFSRKGTCTTRSSVSDPDRDLGLCGEVDHTPTGTLSEGQGFVYTCTSTYHDPGGCQDSPRYVSGITAGDIAGLFPACFCGTIQIDIAGIGGSTKSMACGCSSPPTDERENPPEEGTACGDGILDIGEQCESGNPVGTTCGWETSSCNQNSCTCSKIPSQNPDWSINKFGSEACVVDGSASSVSYTIVVTNIGAVDGQISTIEDTLDTKVIESEIDLASISPSATVFGNIITWNLSGAAATFTSGESKTYTYSINVPSDEFGTYDNTVVVTPVSGDPFQATSQIEANCVEDDPDVPSTGLFDTMVGRVVAAGMLITAGLAYMYLDSVWGTTMNIASYFGYDQRLDRARKKFEKRLED